MLRLLLNEHLAYIDIVKTNLESPTGPKLKRKVSAEPTMTLHTKAATNDILDIFNQPLGNIDLLSNQPESGGESDYEDDDYTSAGESTGTGRLSARGESEDDDREARNITNHEETDIASASPWSDFTASKHLPKLDMDNATDGLDPGEAEDQVFVMGPLPRSHQENEDDGGIITPVSPERGAESYRSKFVPVPPENYQAPNGPYRDPSQAIQNRLPFMTPIVEKTESSIGALTIREDYDYFNSKTPSRWKGDFPGILETDERLSSPIKGIIDESMTDRPKIQSPPGLKTVPGKASPINQKLNQKVLSLPIINDAQCNPTDESIRKSILDNLQPQLSSHSSYFDHRPLSFNKSAEIRKFVRSLAKPTKASADKTSGNPSPSSTLQFPSPSGSIYTIKRELGKGAFAPVYLIQEEDPPDQPPSRKISRLSALKCEHPPSSWEFYIMATLQYRLTTLDSPHPALKPSVLAPHALHLFADEAYLLEEYLDQGTLLNLVNLAKPDPPGVLDEAIAMFFTVELMRTVEAMHALGILHGDLKADNCLVRLPALLSSSEWDAEYHSSGAGGWSQKGLCLIDFGRGIDLHQFTPQVQFVADWKTDKADCAEMREMRPWTWQVDYWGMAGVAHSLLFGKYIEDVVVDAEGGGGGGVRGRERISGGKKWKLKEPLKRYWQTELWGPFFDVLLNPVSTAAMAGTEEEDRMPLVRTLRTCRGMMEEWLEREAGRRGLKAGLRRLEERINREQKGR